MKGLSERETPIKNGMCLLYIYFNLREDVATSVMEE